MKVPCGWCIDGIHDKCVGAIRSPQGGLWFCDHPDRNPTLRCVDCGNKTEGDIDPEHWECIGEHPRRTNRKIFQARARVQSSATAPAKKPKLKMVMSRDCTCRCGGQTRGGLFLPGHDSRYLSAAVRSISDGTEHLDTVLAEMKDAGVSDALRNKLMNRLGA